MSASSTFMSHAYSGLEPSQAFDIVSGGRFEHRLFSAARSSMVHQRLVLDELMIETGSYDFAVIANGVMPSRSVCIGIVAEGSEVTRYNTSDIGSEDVQVYPGSVELLYHAAGPSRWINVNVAESRLQNAAQALSGRPLTLPSKTAASFRLRSGGRAELVQMIDDAIALARSLEPAGMASDLARAISGSILTAYAGALTRAQAISRKQSATAVRHHLLIVACERLALSSNEVELTMAELAERSGYSPRALQLIFRRSVGMTPNRWFMNIRLNGALRDLVAAKDDLTVAGVARKWGFRHLARFAQYYRAMFGELPSDTLRRSR